MTTSTILRLKAVLAFFLLSFCITITAHAQSCPAQDTEIFPDLSGQELIDALVEEYKTTVVLSYNEAREEMYGNIDNVDGFVEGIYTGYKGAIDPDGENPRLQAVDVNINAEHSWPQSKGATEGSTGHSDMHHLYPAFSSANSSRGNHPFAEIPDDETEAWWLYDQQYSTPQADSIDYYSERKEGHPSGQDYPSGSDYDSWEPRESSEGDIARSMFYFYTMYKDLADDADPVFFEIQKEFLRTWNSLDDVSTKEYNRTCAIAEFQSGKVNPFVIDPTLVERAYFEGQVSQTNVFFSASILNLNEGQATLDIEVSITNPNPDTATTVDVMYAGGTATPGEDFESISTQTLTFPAGSLERQSFSVNLIDDDTEETDETILLELQNVSGPQQAVIAEPDSAEITIRDNDGVLVTTAWVNEFHYDNDGADQDEFVEIAVKAEFADLSNVNLTLYNGSNGTSYASYSGNDFELGNTQNGISFYYVETNGLQNGSPDGLSLDIGGDLIQFLSYEGTFTAEDGPAQDVGSTDIGAEQAGSAPVGSSVSLAGSGSVYSDFSWEFTESSTMGFVNTNQTIEGGSGSDPVLVQFAETQISAFEDEGNISLDVNIINATSETDVSVDISLVGGTSSEDDYESFETQTLTFSGDAETSQSFSFTISDDDAYEKNETVLFALGNVSGGQAGINDTLEVTIINEDAPSTSYLWVNEFHYQNAGPDSSEFVEIAFLQAIPVKQNSSNDHNITLTLYNGASGEAYATFSDDDIVLEDNDSNGTGHVIYSVDVTGIQNGDPDGISLSQGDRLEQFISYGGSFAAVDGPAKDYQSTDIGIIEPASVNSSHSLALTGSGSVYQDFTWAATESSTNGDVNNEQELRVPSSNEEDTETVTQFKLQQNYPNPFNPSTVISYQLPENSNVRLEVFDMLGRKVASLVNNERKAAGSHQVTFDAINLSSGVYIYRLSINTNVQLTKKMLLMK